jgi:hypothetical protein
LSVFSPSDATAVERAFSCCKRQVPTGYPESTQVPVYDVPMYRACHSREGGNSLASRAFLTSTLSIAEGGRLPQTRFGRVCEGAPPLAGLLNKSRYPTACCGILCRGRANPPYHAVRNPFLAEPERREGIPDAAQGFFNKSLVVGSEHRPESALDIVVTGSAGGGNSLC